MPVISLKYWNVVYGISPDEVLKDEEGISIVKKLAVNMAFFLKCKEAGIKAGIELPKNI